VGLVGTHGTSRLGFLDESFCFGAPPSQIAVSWLISDVVWKTLKARTRFLASSHFGTVSKTKTVRNVSFECWDESQVTCSIDMPD